MGISTVKSSLQENRRRCCHYPPIGFLPLATQYSGTRPSRLDPNAIPKLSAQRRLPPWRRFDKRQASEARKDNQRIPVFSGILRTMVLALRSIWMNQAGTEKSEFEE